MSQQPYSVLSELLLLINLLDLLQWKSPCGFVEPKSPARKDWDHINYKGEGKFLLYALQNHTTEYSFFFIYIDLDLNFL